ncbi:MAG TPA: sulfatase-like hydrolase/transferase [Acidobacteriota bacterium]|nr:sulfatase-like hydrolase/transferase [Acidobacteriota bacterium]
MELPAIESRGRIITKALCLSALLCLLHGSAALAEDGRPPLVLITIDTLRADHVSAFHSESPVQTPVMDALAADGVAYLRAFTTNPLTFPAHASLMTSQWPIQHGVRDFTGYRLEDEVLTLAEVLSGRGYRTAAFVSAAVLDHRTGMAQGFDIYDDEFAGEGFLGQGNRVAERPGRQTLDRALQWLQEQSSQQPFFLWLHLFEPHDPYEPPQPYRSRASSPYAGEVAYSDALTGELVEALRAKKLYRPALISMLSDHGEGLGEHGESRHGFFIYQSTMHVPWILKFPSNRHAGARPTEPVSLVDALPTFLQALEVERRHWPPHLQGRSRLRQAMGQDSGRLEPLYLESLTPLNQFGWSDLRGLVSGRYKLIEAPRPELYDLLQDPRERHNLFEQEGARGRRLQDALREFEARYAAARNEDASADPQPEMDAELQERLRSIGYVGTAAPATSGLSREGLADPKDKIEAYEKLQAGVEAARQRRWTEALALLQRAHESAPEAPAILSSLALTSRDAGRAQEALKWFRQALEAVPDDHYLRLQMAQYLLRLRQDDEARLQFEAILQTRPRHFLAHFNLGVHHARSGDFETAARYLSQALDIRDDAEAARMLGLCQIQLKRLPEAEASLLTALELAPENPAVHANLASLYSALGDSEKALQHQRKARSLAGKNP